MLVPHSPGAEYAGISTKVGQNTRGKNICAIKMRKKRSFIEKSVLCLDAYQDNSGVRGRTGNGRAGLESAVRSKESLKENLW